MDGEAWQATVNGVAKELDTTEWLNNATSQQVIRVSAFSGQAWCILAALIPRSVVKG